MNTEPKRIDNGSLGRIDRRMLVLGMFVLLAVPGQALAHTARRKFVLEERFLPQNVRSPYDYPAGTIVVVPREKYLYLVGGAGSARRYGIGVGKAGLAFTGSAVIGRKAKWPSWRPTDNMIRRDPDRYGPYAGGLPGGLGNPLGARALYIGGSLYRIHGTNQPWTIGQNVSSGCIRMRNEDVIELYNRVGVGTKVVVIR